MKKMSIDKNRRSNWSRSDDFVFVYTVVFFFLPFTHSVLCVCRSLARFCFFLLFLRENEMKEMCQITSSNFDEVLPAIESDIRRSSFLAIDTEFSSLSTLTSSLSEKPRGTVQQIYEQRVKLIKQLTVFQIGFAFFFVNEQTNGYDYRIYNFSLRPTSIEPIDVKFVVQSSSIKFLCEHQFDFNRCFYQGISFLNQTEENRLIHSIKVRQTID